MSGKKISIGVRPTQKPALPTADDWVSSRDAAAAVEQTASAVVVQADQADPMKRLTIDIPLSLHRAIKSQCGQRGTKMVDEIRELLVQKYGNTETLK